jgi:CubicO group peptidase (beta-lactamase class C family)
MKIFLSFSMILSSFVLFSQNYSAEVEARIKEVEDNMVNQFTIEGQPNATLKECMAFQKIAGLSVAVINNYKIEWAKGYGWADSSEERAVTIETLFEPGSISKSLNSVGILKLAQEKKLDLYTDINNYLTTWKFPYDSKSNGKKITIANLLSHTAGLSVHGFEGYEMGALLPTLPQLLDGKQPANSEAIRSEFEPGLKYQYSGGGTTITQLILTEITKQPYDKWMFENVLKPMGMINSSYSQPQPKEKQKLMATGYLLNGAVKGKYHVYPEQAAAGLWTTPTDICKFMIEMQLSLKGQSNKVLTQSTTQLQLKPYIDSATGLGIFIVDIFGEKYFNHPASNEGFCGKYCASYDGGKGVAIFCNSANGGAMIDELINSIARIYKWKGFDKKPPLIEKKEIKLEEPIADKFIGFYQSGNTIFEINKKGGMYYFRNFDEPFRIYFTSDSSFINLESSSEKIFIFDKDQKVSGVKRVVSGKVYDTEKKIKILIPPEIELKKFVGLYLLAKDTISVFLKNGRVFMKYAESNPSEIRFISPDEFFVSEEPGFLYRFTSDKKGSINGLEMKNNEKTMEGEKIQ